MTENDYNLTDSIFIRTLLRLGSPSVLAPEERRKRVSAVFVLLVSVLVTSTFSVYHLFSGHYQVVILDGLGFTVALFGLYYLRRHENGDYVYRGIGFGFVILCSTTTIIGRSEISYFFWSFLLPAVIFSVLGDRKGMIASLFFFCLSLVLMTVPETVLPSPPYSTFIVARYSVIYVALTFTVYYYEASQQMLIRYIQREKDRFENASKRDPLTGLSNRRDILERMETEYQRQARSGRPFALILGDIDNFKNLNDTCGHDCGDSVLSRVARLIKNQVRGIDCPSRWGGEEFLIMLVETDRDGAFTVAERIRKKIQDTDFTFKGKPLPVTMTFGLSVFHGTGDDAEACIRRADQALYEGKRQGKNRVVAAD
ncbi:MAG: GGDEF domain-containing protein [Thermodesulfobacteriota bacterium]